jgi:hypothetical protein
LHLLDRLRQLRQNCQPFRSLQSPHCQLRLLDRLRQKDQLILLNLKHPSIR